MSTDDVLNLSAPYVSDMAKDFDVSEETVEAAVELARKTDREHPVNRHPQTVGAACLYIEAMFRNEKITQDEIHRVTGTSTVALSRCYREIARAEGLPVKLPERGGSESTATDPPGFFDRVLPWR